MPPLRAIAAVPGPAPQRLRRLFDALIAVKRRRATDDPELFSAYPTLAADAESVAAGRAMLLATSRFHHPAHTAEWVDPSIDAAYNDVWQLLTDGLCAARSPRAS